MTHTDYFKIVNKRGSFNKKALLMSLVCFVPYSLVRHDVENMSYSICLKDISPYNVETLSLLHRVTHKFSVESFLLNGNLILRYAW